jgi:NTE family protein
MKKIAIALGGGGARCFAHLGMIDELQNNNIPIDYISSSSMGSIIGILIANGVPISDIKKEFYKKIRRLNWFRPHFSRNGLMSQSNITSLLKKLLPQTKIENTKILISIVATNLNTGKLHLFENGDSIKSTCASCAFPGIYKPITLNNQFMVDGGILNNVPADICRQKIGQDNIVISSMLEGPFDNSLNSLNNPFQIVWRAIYIPLIHSRAKIVKENSDVILKPLDKIYLNFHNWRDILKFYNVKKMEQYYQKGKEETQKKMPLIKKLLIEEEVL